MCKVSKLMGESTAKYPADVDDYIVYIIYIYSIYIELQWGTVDYLPPQLPQQSDETLFFQLRSSSSSSA